MAAVDRARWAPLAALTAMNLLNYIDRYVVTALLPELQAEIALTDAQAGFLATAFMVVYFVSSPLFGWLGDRGTRPRILGFGVLLWSFATALGGLACGFRSLFLARAAVGIGEAAYGSIAPSLITDIFPKARHGRALSLFYLATPVGSALGYLLGGVLGARLGWRPAFYVVGLPGILLGALAFRLEDPARVGAPFVQVMAQGVRQIRLRNVVPLASGVWQHVGRLRRDLLANRVYAITVAGYTAYTFGLGGFAFWAPSYMMRERGFSQEAGMLTFGGITVVTGAIGTLLGGTLGDRLRRRTVKGYTWVNVLAATLGGVMATVSLYCPNNAAFLAALAGAQLCLFLVTGPVNALIVGSVPAEIRGSAMAMSIFCIHLFGDAISPLLIGHISDASSLSQAMLIAPATFVLAAIVWATSLWRRRR